MRTLREIYCEKHQCTARQFQRRVFWLCLYPHARVFAPFFLLLHYDFFSPDRALISCAADAVTMARIRDDVRDYFWDSENRSWVREKLRIRVSGQRLKNFARIYLPEGTAFPFAPRESGSNPPV